MYNAVILIGNDTCSTHLTIILAIKAKLNRDR